MPPKKDKGKKGKKGKAPEFTDEDIDAFIKCYQKFCKDAGLPVHDQLVKQLQEEDECRSEFKETQQLLIHPADPQNEDEPRLGPGGTRALCTAILGTAPPGESHGKPLPPTPPFKAVKSIRAWHSNVGDDGAAALAEVLRLGGAEVQLAYLELWDNGVGARGCRALGVALMMGSNRSLQTLRLDYNEQVGSEGCANLCRGLRSNATLKQLHLGYCGIGPAAASALGEALSYDKCGLVLLNLEGNKLGDRGLEHLCPGLHRNTSLLELSLADNSMGADPEESPVPMETFARVLAGHKSLATLDLNYNRLCVASCAALLPGLQDPNDPAKPHPRLKKVTVDAALEGVSPELYEKLNVEGGGGKKGGKKGKKKK